ncbi:LytR/AlgR family response regulator transcription factor [Sediminibacterium soli]|uniref:LytR/AlgR family response regulator transcription factor n=1 Tax=Sediminibacterium soli TaxID=2698829 RepID=UPI001379FE2A|nr:response regulator transcription factor [Sediminibacterium soli]NCI45231.1 response regulator transcription factor [Sediminibacterium soli]
MIRCIIVDDEQPAIDVLVTYVSQSPLLQLAGTFTNPLGALKMVSEDDIQLVFLDVQMPELSGMDFIHAINGKSQVILTTAYSEFALKGYDLDVVDYLVKPIRLPRFLQAVQKAAARIGDKKEAAEVIPAPDHIFVKTGTRGKLQRISFAEIGYIEGMKNYVAFACGKQKILVYASMKEIEEHLPADRFMRVHKSFIIPINNITGIEGNTIHLKDVDTEILIGENYKAELMRVIGGNII